MSQHRAHTSRRIGVTALALLAAVPSVAAAQATDGSITTLAQIGDPADLGYTQSGDLLVADRASNRIRRIQPSGTVVRGAGTGDPAQDCNDGTEDLTRPRGIATGIPGGGFLTTSGNCIMRVLPSGDTVRFAGASTGAAGATGDGGPARDARLSSPGDMATGPDGSIFIADTANDRIRRVAPDGTITTFAGTTTGFGGDGGPATEAQLDTPRDVEVLPDGSVLIADVGNDRVRKVAPDGTITTVAGGNGQGFAGDGDPAATAQLSTPVALVALTNGGFLVADTGNDRVRRITPLGAIFTVAGGGPGGPEGGPAKDARLDTPEGLAARPGGGFVIADTGGGAVRAVSDFGAVPGAAFGRSLNVSPGQGDVTVRPAGQRDFLPLREDDLVPFNSRVDARGGKLRLAVRREDGSLEPALVDSGKFVAVGRGDATNLRLNEKLNCGARRSARAFLAKKRKKRRRLWVDAEGAYRIKGRYVGALERGTKWLVVDTCNSSTVSVVEGSVIAVSRVDGRRRVVRAGQTFTVRARRARRGR